MTTSAGALAPTKQVANFRYDFAKHGGAVGDIVLDSLLPGNAIVTSGAVHVTQQVTSGGLATVAAMLNSAEDVLAETAIAGLTTGAILDVVPDGNATNFILTAAPIGLTITIGTEALTAGEMTVFLEYYQSG